MTDLSPAAQAVRDAAFEPWQSTDTPESIAAAALRAAVEQVVPDDLQEAMHFTTEAIRLNRQGVRRQFLAIAAELEAQP